MFLMDLHVHTSQISPCANLSAEDTVRAYAGAGYDGICVTDHYTREFFERRTGSWEDRTRAFARGYELAAQTGRGLDLTVLFGFEIRIDGSPNDYLVYGISPEQLCGNPELYACDLPGLSKIVRSLGGLLFQAHPFRRYLTLADTSLLDGLEVFNGNPRHDSQNLLAIETAAREGLIMLSGSDSHQAGDCGMGGMAFKNRIHDSAGLISALQKGEFTLLVSPEKFIG